MNVFSMKNMAMVITYPNFYEFLKVIMAMFTIAFKTFAFERWNTFQFPLHINPMQYAFQQQTIYEVNF